MKNHDIDVTGTVSGLITSTRGSIRRLFEALFGRRAGEARERLIPCRRPGMPAMKARVMARIAARNAARNAARKARKAARVARSVAETEAELWWIP